MRDLVSNLGLGDGIVSQVINSGGGAKDTGNVDLQGFNSCLFLVDFGANGGDTLDDTNKFTVKLEHAADDGAGSPDTYEAVESADVIIPTVGGCSAPSSGVVITVDDAAEDAKKYYFGYIGDRRFVKLTVTPNGTLTNGNPVCVAVVKGHASVLPVNPPA